ncbi:phospholipase D3-like isoform X2 [Mizuhopecten yessoensis]|uniref:Phospholipase D3 n=1 Tax=Mizuhopecten yessoensis TaxID=6573 RepID=A0A210QXC2_MIZYE|nr:phospholipase D3-like isoform X1 [Mizuhopecten yessoensis]XP_021347307.1 phospholipase D3-like isoform X1 [Mizuhopecten yessoensis]XP_021347308.1 phospholipase D3-like isoform X2 [Mizuhopecten yessoensis]OWF53408.1 Phospholipase D3 [Mizuhopecten yessoensis]
MKNDRIGLVNDHDDMKNHCSSSVCTGRCLSIIFFCIGVVLMLSMGLALYFSLHKDIMTVAPVPAPTVVPPPPCKDPCVITLVESIPENLTYPAGSPSHPSTYSALIDLMEMATSQIEIASFYWTLSGSDIEYHDNSSWQGESVLSTLMAAGRFRKLKIKIAQNKPDNGYYNNTRDLARYAGAEVRTLDFKSLMGNGILHTKMWLIDRKHFYVGSANLDWRSFTQVKEMGAVIRNCPCMARDMGKLFDVYWDLGLPGAKVPSQWPTSYNTDINNNNTMEINFNSTNVAATTYISSSPPPFCPAGRTVDVDAIVDIIQKAEEFVYVAVMDYFPTTQFTKPRVYWPVIDDAFRRAAFNRRVKVHLLISYWQHTWEDMKIYLSSLNDLWFKSYPELDITVKIFEVPAFTDSQKKIPYGRVNHNKYMVTDKTAYIGTSNWSADYFIDTGGIGLVINQQRTPALSKEGDVRQQLEDVFLRDWNSKYAWDFNTFNFTSVDRHTEL